MSELEREQGPIEGLCREIGLPFDKRLERPEMLLAFVRELVEEVALLMEREGKSEPAEAALAVARLMVEAKAADEARQLAGQVHDISHTVDEQAVDRPLALLAFCASAIRFGLEIPCRSRHAAEAANQIWATKYGVWLFDKRISAWRSDWARGAFQAALASTALEAWDDPAHKRVAGLRQTFDLRWKADMRAIKRWQEADPGNDLTWPDHADLVVWLLERDAKRVAEAPIPSQYHGATGFEVERFLADYEAWRGKAK